MVMYGHVNQQAEVIDSLPSLFRNAKGYRRQLAIMPEGVMVTGPSSDRQLTAAIRAHSQEVSVFVRDGMPAMTRGMMGG